MVWITGLPGAGKSTTARVVAERLRQRTPAVVHLDGDTFRAVMGQDVGYDRAGRLANAWRMARLCHLLSGQGQLVVCSTVSLFREIHAWNRANMAAYLEVFLRVRMETLQARDQKGMYSGARAGSVAHVPGVDQAVEVPESPDLVLDTDGGLSPEDVAARILEKL